MVTITSVMALPCYLISTLYLFKISYRKDYPDNIFASRRNGLITGFFGSAYGLWLMYAAGFEYLMVACTIYAIGIPLYIAGVRQHQKKGHIFKVYEIVILAIVVLLGAAGIVYFVSSRI